MGAHNALVGRLLDRAGVDGGWVSSLEISASLGLPDVNVLGMREMLDAVRYINLATRLPLIVDAENGYGSTDGAVRAVRELESADVAGMCLDDTRFPKKNSFSPGAHDIETPERFAGKLQAVKSAQASPDFVVIARTESLIAGESLDAALDRAHLYADAGADLALIHSSRSDGSEAVEVARRWRGPIPLVSIPTAFPQLGRAALAELGYRVIIFANQLLRASIWNMELVLDDILRDRVAEAVAERTVGLDHLFELAAGGANGGDRAEPGELHTLPLARAYP